MGRTCGEPDEIELTRHGGEIKRLATGLLTAAQREQLRGLRADTTTPRPSSSRLEVVDYLSADELAATTIADFQDTYMGQNRPVVADVSRHLALWPASKVWSDMEALKRMHGHEVSCLLANRFAGGPSLYTTPICHVKRGTPRQMA